MIRRSLKTNNKSDVKPFLCIHFCLYLNCCDAQTQLQVTLQESATTEAHKCQTKGWTISHQCIVLLASMGGKLSCV